jgi:pimeloyl-ACP methyl ester carboxylesterase
MSVGTVGNIGTPPKEIMDVLLENKPTQQFAESLAGFMRSWRVLNGDFPLDEQMAADYTKDLYERSQHPVGVAWSHIKAQEGFHDLAAQLASITVPAFFIHGEKDPLIPVAAGIATAHAVPNAKMAVIPGMGHMIFNHDLENTIANMLIENFKSVDGGE